MEEGTLVEWLKREGQTVQAGEPLFAIEGDKAVQEVEAIGSGILRLAPQAPKSARRSKSAPRSPTCSLRKRPKRSVPAMSRRSQQRPSGPPFPKRTRISKTEIVPSEPAVATSPGRGNRPRISPRAARVAAELGVDWKTLQGTGRTGRIRERDVLNAVARQRPGRRGRTAPHRGRFPPAALRSKPIAARSPLACSRDHSRRPP